MRALIAFDKFKEALGASAACQAVADALRTLHPDWELDLCPLSDGGDGFVEALSSGDRGEVFSNTVTGPLSSLVSANWAVIPARNLSSASRRRLQINEDGSVAVLEMAACSGLALVKPAKRNPLRATTAGVGELIRHAQAVGAGTILLGVGGSATNDLGLGALAELGFRCLDAEGQQVTDPKPCGWSRIQSIIPPDIETSPYPPIWIACDVTNPLTGPHGATFTYGPQKGLHSDDLATIDREMARLAGLLAQATGHSHELFDAPGAGAAGGIAGGLMAGLNAKLVSGFDLVAEWLDLEQRISKADIVITGEGAFDATSLLGKGPGGLVRRAVELQKRAVVLAGRVNLPDAPRGAELYAITPTDMPLNAALANTARLLQEATLRHL